MEKKLYRSRTDKTIAGICGGLGKYINVDPTIVRVIYVIASLFMAGFPGLILYIILYFIMPEEPAETDVQSNQNWQPYQAWSPQQPEPPQADD